MKWQRHGSETVLVDGMYRAEITNNGGAWHWSVARNGAVIAADFVAHDSGITPAEEACEAAISQHRAEWERDSHEPTVSRRERIATAALRGIGLTGLLLSPAQVAEECARRADALMTELDKPKEIP